MKTDLALPLAEKSLFEHLKKRESLIEYKLNWTELFSDMDSHLHAIKNGKDYDDDGELHSVHLQYLSSILTEYYHVHPKGDNRLHKYMQIPKIGLDIDEVLADWVNPWVKHYKLQKPT